jgi:hypothetical protein
MQMVHDARDAAVRHVEANDPFCGPPFGVSMRNDDHRFAVHFAHRHPPRAPSTTRSSRSRASRPIGLRILGQNSYNYYWFYPIALRIYPIQVRPDAEVVRGAIALRQCAIRSAYEPH